MKKSFGAKPLIYPMPVWCIGTYDAQGKPNIATVAWGGICSSKPPCVMICLRKATYSYGNIMEKKAYTISVPSAAFVREADYCGMASGRTVDKFKETGLTAVPSNLVDAPYVAQFPLVMECKLIHQYEIGIHTHFVGEILDVKIEESMLTAEGKPDALKIDPLIYGPEVQHYFTLGKVAGKAFEIGKR